MSYDLIYRRDAFAQGSTECLNRKAQVSSASVIFLQLPSIPNPELEPNPSTISLSQPSHIISMSAAATSSPAPDVQEPTLAVEAPASGSPGKGRDTKRRAAAAAGAKKATTTKKAATTTAAATKSKSKGSAAAAAAKSAVANSGRPSWKDIIKVWQRGLLINDYE